MLELINVSKSFGNKNVVDSFSLRMNNACLGLLGPNGSGKTTTLKLLSTLLYPDSGEIIYNGLSIHKNAKEWKKKIGVIPEYPELFENLTIFEHIYLLTEIYEVREKNTTVRIQEYLEYFQLDKYKDTLCSECSQGMKKKLSIILAIVHNPEVLILDEPFNGLDMHGIKGLKDLLLKYWKIGKTIIITSHLLDTMEKVLESVAIIDNGKLVDCRHIESVLRENTTLEDYYFNQVGIAVSNQGNH
jgi:ABC-type multidrug transport system ATPase subunit